MGLLGTPLWAERALGESWPQPRECRKPEEGATISNYPENLFK